MGGESGFKGYSYQSLAFFNELLNPESIKGQLEKEDDFFIEKNGDISVCAQTKDVLNPLGKKEINTFANNFLNSFRSGKSNKFIVVSPFGISKNIDLLSTFRKSANEEFTDTEVEGVVELITEVIMTRDHILSEISSKIGDAIKDHGGSIKTRDASKIIELIIGKFFLSQKEITSEELREVIKKEGLPFIVDLPTEDLSNASDLVKKYLERGLESKEGLISSVNFYKRSRRSLTPNPTLSSKFQKLLSDITNTIRSNKIENMSYDEFNRIFKIEVDKSDGDLKEFILTNKEIINESYNKLMGDCFYYPK